MESLVTPLHIEHSTQEFLQRITNTANLNDEDEPFYVIDIGDIIQKYKIWSAVLPRIQPFYAVKCNSDSGIVATLIHLGAGLDVASIKEIKIASDVGAKAENVIYANTCKGISHLKIAAKEGIRQMTFDSAVELYRIKRIMPDARLVMRLLVDDTCSQYQLGIKAGVPFSRVLHLFKLGLKLGLNIIGISFHVGSNCSNPAAFTKAIERARKAFNIANELGLKLSLLDIGGGYPGEVNPLFEGIYKAINEAINIHFPADSGIRLIAEPGRYMVHSSSILVVNVINKRLRYPDDDDVQIEGDDDMNDLERMYHINDGLAGSFAFFLGINKQFIPKKLIYKNEKCNTSSIWGPTCASMDYLLNGYSLPEMEAGEWVYFENMGAYKLSVATEFNGFKTTDRHYFIDERYWNEFKEELPSNLDRYAIES